MSLVLMSEKGQVTIPRDLREKLHIRKGDALMAELDPRGGIRLMPAAVLPMENYSDERLAEFAKEDAVTPAERRRIRKRLDA